MKIIQDPFKNTIRGVVLDQHISKPTVLANIRAKIMNYGICSDLEQRYLDQHTDYISPLRARR